MTHLVSLLPPRCAQAVPAPKIASTVPLLPSPTHQPTNTRRLHFTVEIAPALRKLPIARRNTRENYHHRETTIILLVYFFPVFFSMFMYLFFPHESEISFYTLLVSCFFYFSL